MLDEIEELENLSSKEAPEIALDTDIKVMTTNKLLERQQTPNHLYHGMIAFCHVM